MSLNWKSDFFLEVRRQILHVAGIGSIPAVLSVGLTPVIFGFTAQIIFFTALGVYITNRHTRWLEKIVYVFERRGGFPFAGALTWAIGAALTFLLFPRMAAFAGIAVLSFADATSTLVGKYRGAHKLPLNKEKSWEGSAAFFIIAVLVLQFFVDPALSIFIAIVVSQIEMLPKIDDNITIPLSVGFLVWVFGSVV